PPPRREMNGERLAPGVALTLCFRMCCGASLGSGAPGNSFHPRRLHPTHEPSAALNCPCPVPLQSPPGQGRSGWCRVGSFAYFFKSFRVSCTSWSIVTVKSPSPCGVGTVPFAVSSDLLCTTPESAVPSMHTFCVTSKFAAEPSLTLIFCLPWPNE